MKIFIEPNDVLMFRDGKPFSGGDDHYAYGLFPPFPSTIYGALRSHILSTWWSEFNKFAEDPKSIPPHIRKEIGTPFEDGVLNITQFSLAKKDNNQLELYFPIPKDIVKEKGKENGKFYILKPENRIKDIVKSDLSMISGYMWYPTDSALESTQGFISLKEMERYLVGNTPTLTEIDELFKTEERTGIGKSRKTRSVETGRLYSVQYFRLNKNYGFAVEINNTKLLPENGILRIGGDTRSARYLSVSWNDISFELIKKKIIETRRFKLVLTTPAIFKNGWLPCGINPETMEGLINGIKLKFISACLGKPIFIGGFDIIMKTPKIMKKAVPAGSIYYCEVKENNINNIFDKLWLKSISDDKPNEGFGITLIGGF